MDGPVCVLLGVHCWLSFTAPSIVCLAREIVTSKHDVYVDLILIRKYYYYYILPYFNFSVYVSSMGRYMLPRLLDSISSWYNKP